MFSLVSPIAKECTLMTPGHPPTKGFFAKAMRERTTMKEIPSRHSWALVPQCKEMRSTFSDLL